jgi:hypothetical protein
MTWLHHLLCKHTFMTKGDARIILCGPRWRRRTDVWFRPRAGALWEEVEDLDELLARL